MRLKFPYTSPPVSVRKMDSTDAQINITPMSAQEARECIDAAQECINAIQENSETLKRVLLRLHRGQGWEALGYASWRECAMTEFEQGQAYVYRLVQAAEVEENLEQISTRVETDEIPVSHLVALSKLPKDQQAEGLLKANEIAQRQGRKRSTAHVTQAVKLVKQKLEPPLAKDLSVQAPSQEQEHPTDLSRVNSASEIDAIIDSKGVRAFAHEFVAAEPDVRVRIRRYYPGVDIIIRSELGEQVLARIQDIDGAFDQPVDAAPNTVEQELTQQAENLGLPTSSKQVLPDVERNHFSPVDVDDRPFASASLNTNVNVTIVPPSDVSHFQDEQLKQLIKDAKQTIRVAKLELNKRHHPEYLK